MKQFLAAVFLIGVFLTATAAGPIGSLGNVNTQVIAGFTFNAKDPNYIVLRGYSDTGSLDYTNFADQSGVFYQVPAGKVLHIYAIEFVSQGTNLILSFGYSTASAGFAQGSAPAGAVYFYSGATGSRFIASNNGQGSWATQYAFNASVPSGDYVFSKSNNASTNITIYGYLE